jgi:hypothetical protein
MLVLDILLNFQAETYVKINSAQRSVNLDVTPRKSKNLLKRQLNYTE